MGTKTKMTLIICATVLGCVAMITGTELPAWLIRLGTVLFGGF